MAFRIKCKCCGNEFTAKSEYRKYCNAECYEKYYRIKKEPLPAGALCRFNKGVVCEKCSCESCGWNPEVAEKRNDKIRAEMEEKYGQ